ncbi:hypothetical protein HY008_00725 [Candidatus Woesebacteria bacterium]|nr:hypothetical protein [Candidatus Woesebacteria bacterium]
MVNTNIKIGGPQDSANIGLVTPSRKKFLIIGLIFVILLLVLNVLAKLINIPKKPEVSSPVISVQPTPKLIPINQKITNPSNYAYDSEVLEIESDVLLLDQKLVELNIREPRLDPPTFNFDVDFKR